MKFLYMFLLIFFIYLTLANCITPNNINLDHVSSPLSTILMRGWMKYFTFTPNLDFEEKPKTFFINQKFFHQFEAKNQYNILNTNIKDEYGYINIPSQFYFFFVLSNETLYVINARRVFIINKYIN